VPFSEDTPAELIESIKPNTLIKGADYKEDEIVGAKFVKANGGTVQTITLVPGISSSEIIRRAQQIND
jgi:D-beta-D-heptose 7-phosphate kinase/D-beta-D-heptose 1-phosphate adenosyltransferase